MEIWDEMAANWQLATACIIAVYFFLRTAWLKKQCRKEKLKTIKLEYRLEYERPAPPPPPRDPATALAMEYQAGVREVLGNTDSEYLPSVMKAYADGMVAVLEKAGHADSAAAVKASQGMTLPLERVEDRPPQE